MIKDIELANSLYFDYEKYLELSLTSRRFRHSEILPLIKAVNHNLFKITKEGNSVEGREIFSISLGNGNRKILCWSQMHGDESTATMAIFDLINFFSAQDNYDAFRKFLLEHITICFIPMLNPDGAETFSRRNKAGIDINRDAARLISPEAEILNAKISAYKPDYGFNLHDQDIHYTAGNCFKSAAISFLAPPYDRINSINHIRLNSMKLISRLYKILSVFIPGHIGKYKDEFEPRAFGDYLQGNHISTVLVESGGWKDDTEKQFLRKLNFLLLLTAFKSIAEDNFKHESIETYNEIPLNETYLFDLLLKNLTYTCNGRNFLIDIGINLEEKTCSDGKNYYYEGRISDIGDLNSYCGNLEFNLNGYEVFPGKTKSGIYNSISELSPSDVIKLLSNGITNIKVFNPPENNLFTSIPLNIILSDTYEAEEEISAEQYANLVIKKNNITEYLVVNGQFFNPAAPEKNFRNALIL